MGSETVIVRVSRTLEPIYDQFLTIQRHRFDELEAALAVSDFCTIERLGHAIKGGAAIYELPEAAGLGARLERAAAVGEVDTISRLIDALRHYFRIVRIVFVG